MLHKSPYSWKTNLTGTIYTYLDRCSDLIQTNCMHAHAVFQWYTPYPGGVVLRLATNIYVAMVMPIL